MPLSPEWALTTTMSAPFARMTGTQRRAVSTRSRKSSLPETLALSQIATPGLVRPSSPTRIGGKPGTRIVLIMYGR